MLPDWILTFKIKLKLFNLNSGSSVGKCPEPKYAACFWMARET